MKRTILFYFLLTSLLFSQSIPQLQREAEREVKHKSLINGQWSGYAQFVDSKEIIFNINGNQKLAPASGLKVFTSSLALYYLGEDYRYQTSIYYDGTINGKTLKGNLYIVGSGDPTLGSDKVTGSITLDKLMNQWVQKIKEKGIEVIEGDIIADDFLFDRVTISDYWNWVDIGNYYGAGTSALCINDNLYHLYFKPGKNTGDAAEVIRTEPHIFGLTFTNNMKTGKAGSGDNGYIFNAPNQFNAVLRGTIPAGVNEFSIKGSIPNPPLFAVQYLHNYLQKNGIMVNGKATVIKDERKYEQAKLIHTHTSPQLKDIVYIVNKRSDNLYTEQILKTTAQRKTGTGSFDEGTNLISSFLKENKIDATGIKLYDGCGLSRSNTITTKSMVELLIHNTKQKYFEAFYNSLGIAGDPKDISFFRNFGVNTAIQKNARIKSGFITGVRSHSGYVTDKKGRLIAFSFIANNHDATSREINEIHTRLMVLLAENE